MKKLIFLPVLALFVFASCKKSSSSPSSGSGSISATIDGKAETFNTDALAVTTSANGVYSIAIAGYQGTVGTSDELALAVAGTSPVTAGSYTFGTTAPDELSLVYVQSGNIEYADNINSNTNVATVTITSVTSTNIQGTFSGSLMLYSGTSSVTTKTVTNGKFNVNFK